MLSPAFASFTLRRGLALLGCRLPWLRAPFGLTLGAVVSALRTLLLAAFDPPFLPLLWPLNLSTLALLGTIAPSFLRCARLLLPIRLHFTAIATPLRLLLATALLTALGPILATLGRCRVATILTPLSASLTLLLTPFDSVLLTSASSIGAIVAPVFAALRADVTAVVAPVIAPVRATPVPGALTVVAVPIGIDREADDRHVGARAVDDQGLVAIAPISVEIAG